MDHEMKDFPAYQRIPDRHINQPTHANIQSDRINLLATSFSKSTFFKLILGFTLICTFILVFTRPCITCHFASFNSRTNDIANKINVKSYQPNQLASLDIKSPHFNSASYNVVSGNFLQRHPSHAHHVALYPSQDFKLEEYIPVSGCSGGVVCHVRVIVSKEGRHVSIDAGFNILSISGASVPVNTPTQKRAYSVHPYEATSWAYTLWKRFVPLLVEIDCMVDMDDIAKAFFFTSKDAASCPHTGHPNCESFNTVRECKLPIVQDNCQLAFEKCEYKFLGEDGLPTFSIDGKPDKSFTPVIVSKDPHITLGVLNSNNVVPQFIEDDGVYPITDFGSQPFAPTQFKPYDIWQVKGSGIGHQTFHADQEKLARNRCIRIYFTHIQLLHPTSNLNNVPESENKCVVFRTK